jgi:Flp pilus assembly protein TadG
MMCLLRNEKRRLGATVPLFAILLIPLLGMLAFSIDIGYIALVRTGLQIAADAAALAGAEKLQKLYVQYTLPVQTHQNAILSAATTNTPGSPMEAAEKFASFNKAGNVSITVANQDVSFGFTDAQGTYQANYSAYNGDFPNSISVITRRDKTKNTPVSPFFGAIFGFPPKELETTATATIYSGDVTSLQVIEGVDAHILPVALDMNFWQQFYNNGTSPDGTIHTAANGYSELHVYPCPANARDSFGLLDVGPSSNKKPAFMSWINNGQSPNDISYLLNNNLLPVSISSPKQWKCGPQLTSAFQSNFASEMGVPNLLPLFIPASAPAGMQALSTGSYQAASGKGKNATYAIVGFAGVCISQAGSSDISVQPCAVVDPTAVIPNPKPVGTQTSQFGHSTIITTFISAKLTQ